MSEEKKVAPFVFPADLPRTCSPEMLKHAIRAWSKLATNTEIANILGVPVKAVPRWVESQGWQSLVRDMRQETDFGLETACTRLGFKALSELQDRLLYGDHIVFRDGTTGRKLLPAETLAKVASMLFDKRAEARRLVEGTDEATQGRVFSALDIIADALRNHANVTKTVLAIAPTAAAPIDVTPT